MKEKRIRQEHIERCERQGCTSWDEYCNQNGLNYHNLFEEEEYDDED